MSNKHVKELQIARDRIKSLECNYICDALRLDINDPRYDGWNNIWSKEAKEIKDKIDIAINGAWSVEDWLIKQGFNTGGTRSEEMRQYRLEWIDQMIEYWKDKK